MVRFFGWAHFQPKRKESLLGHPGPGLDLGRGGWIKSDEILTFYTWSQGVFFFDLGTGWAHFQQKRKGSLPGLPGPGLDQVFRGLAWPGDRPAILLVGGGGR